MFDEVVDVVGVVEDNFFLHWLCLVGGCFVFFVDDFFGVFVA